MGRIAAGPVTLTIATRPLHQGNQAFIVVDFTLADIGHANLVGNAQPDQRSRAGQEFAGDPAIHAFDHPAFLPGRDSGHGQGFAARAGDAVFVGQPVKAVEIGPGHLQSLGQPLGQPALAGAGVADDQGSG